METAENNQMAHQIAGLIAEETRRLNRLFDSSQRIENAYYIQPIGLDDFREAFNSIGEDFLSDELLGRTLKELKNNSYKLKMFYPEGTVVLLAAFPCNINGVLFSDEEKNEGKCFAQMIIYEKTGLSSGFGALRPTTHARMLPMEIQQNCSFTVHYESDTPWPDEKDFEKFSEQFKRAYYELRKILKPEK